MSTLSTTTDNNSTITKQDVLGANIQIHCQDFAAYQGADVTDINAPEQIYMRTNYPKIYLKGMTEENNNNNTTIKKFSISDYENVETITKLYNNSKGKIVFFIYPSYLVASGGKNTDMDATFKYMKQLSLLNDYAIYNYPSLSFTPTGNMISAGFFPDKVISRNYLSSEDTGVNYVKNQIRTKDQLKKAYPQKVSGFSYQQGGKDQLEKRIIWNVNKADNILPITASNYGLVGNFCYTDPKNENQVLCQHSFVEGTSVGNIHGSTYYPSKNSSSQSSQTSQTSQTKRVYKLSQESFEDEYLEQDVLTYVYGKCSEQGSGQSDEGEKYNGTIQENLENGLSFFMAFTFRESTAAGYALVKFGTNTIKVDSQGNVQITVNNSKNTSSCNLNQKQNHFIKPTFLIDSPRFEKIISFIVYPVWNGIAIQPGVLNGGGVKNGQSTNDSAGLVVQCQLPKERNNNKYSYLRPDYTQWVKGVEAEGDEDQVDKSRAKHGHIRIMPNNSVWVDENGLRVQMVNTVANFFYSPLYFVPKSKFRMCFMGIKAGKYEPINVTGSEYDYYYKYDGDDSSIISGDKNTHDQYKYQLDEDGEMSIGQIVYQNTYYGSLIYSYPDINDANVEDIKYISEDVKASMIPPIQQGKSKEDKEQFWLQYNKSLYCIDFTINNPGVRTDVPFSRKPVQVWGVLLTHKRDMKNSPIKNDNGTFGITMMSSDNQLTTQTNPQTSISAYTYTDGLTCDCSINKQWIHYATSSNISHDQNGSQGSITIDKYAYMGQWAFPNQSMGGIRLKVTGGNANYIKTFQVQGRSPYIFSGLALQTNHMDSFNSDTLTVNLKGLNHKLQDIKMLNAPFWDGDDLKDILKWLSKYSGVNMDYQHMNSQAKNRRINVSSNFAKPALNIQGGTPALTAINQACKQANHRFILQPDGVGYIYQLDKNYSLPLVTKPGSGTLLTITTDEISSMQVQPFFGNMYNVVISAALKGTNNGNTIEAPNSQDTLKQIQLLTKTSYLQTDPQLPWSRITAFKHQGYMSDKQLQSRHSIDRSMSKKYWVNATVNMPGKPNVWIYDQVDLFGQIFYVYGISHSLDFSSKVFTTSLTLSKHLSQL